LGKITTGKVKNLNLNKMNQNEEPKHSSTLGSRVHLLLDKDRKGAILSRVRGGWERLSGGPRGKVSGTSGNETGAGRLGGGRSGTK